MKIDEIVAEMKPKRYTRKQAAVMVGRDADTLKRWDRLGMFKPSDRRKFGALEVRLYTFEDVKRMKAMASELRPGRKPKEHTNAA